MDEKNMMPWQFETECEERKRGVRLLRSLSGVARSVADSMGFEEIACTRGVVDNLLKTLGPHFEPYLELSLPRAFERAVYGAPRTKQGEHSRVPDPSRACVCLAGQRRVEAGQSSQGYVAYLHASLTEAQDLQFST